MQVFVQIHYYIYLPGILTGKAVAFTILNYACMCSILKGARFWSVTWLQMSSRLSTRTGEVCLFSVYISTTFKINATCVTLGSYIKRLSVHFIL